MEPDILVDDAPAALPDTAPALPRRPLTSRPALAPHTTAPAAPEAAPTDAPVTDDADPVDRAGSGRAGVGVVLELDGHASYLLNSAAMP